MNDSETMPNYSWKIGFHESTKCVKLHIYFRSLIEQHANPVRKVACCIERKHAASVKFRLNNNAMRVIVNRQTKSLYKNFVYGFSSNAVCTPLFLSLSLSLSVIPDTVCCSSRKTFLSSPFDPVQPEEKCIKENLSKLHLFIELLLAEYLLSSSR